MLYQLFVSLNYKVVIHPKLNNTKNRPDFLINDSCGNEFYLEAVVSSGLSEKDVAQKSILNDIFNSINKLYTKDFFIKAEIEKYPTKSIPAKKIRTFLENQLKLLDPDSCEKLFNLGAYDLIPEWKFNFDGFEMKFRPIPKSKEFRSKKTEKPIGITHYGFHWRGENKHILKSLKTKANKYKALRKPYVIAINSLDDIFRREDIIETLFGSEAIYTHTESDNYSTIRVANGLFYSKSGPRYTRVSGVLFINNLLPWTVGINNFQLFVNPWSENKITNFLNDFPKSIVENDRLKDIPGKKLHELMNLPDKWPHNVAC